MSTPDKILVSEETHLRLQREMEEMLRFTDESPGSVGAAVKVVYEEEFANKYNIGRYGRMTVKEVEGEQKRIFHAGSRKIDDAPMFEYAQMDIARMGCRFREGQDMQINKEKMTAKGEWPKPLYAAKNWGLASIERQLFRQIGTVITLVNPSFRTMQALDAMSSQVVKAQVYLTNTFDVQYTRGVTDFVMKSNFLAMSEKIEGVAYLGSGQPNFFPEVPWIRLIPSPYILPNAQFQGFVSHWTEEGYSCTYERKAGYYVNNMLRFDASTYIYNPETVDETFGDEGRPAHLAFLESSHPLKMVDTDERRIYHKPKFITIPLEAVWKELGGIQYRVKGYTIFDVQGPGTYFSRRARNVPPLMYQWAPFQQHGSHWLTLSSLRPRKDYNVEVVHDKQSTFVCFGNTRPVVLERVLSTQRVWIQEDEVPTSIRAVSLLPEVGNKGEVTPLRVWRDEQPHEKGNKEMEIRSEYWKDNQGKVYPFELRKEDSVAWLHQLNQVPTIGPAMSAEPDLKTLPRFVGKSGISFVDVSALREGTYYLCPNREYLVQMVPQAARYYSKNYLNIFTYGPYAKSMEIDGEEYQSKNNPEWNSIVTEFQKTVVTNIGSNARMELSVAETLGMPVSLVSRYVRLHPDMRLWKTGIEGAGQWVHKASNRVRFPDEDNGIGGLYWEDVMESRQSYRTSYDVTEFRKYCLNNGYGFKYHKVTLLEIEFEVKKRR
jgi:hypothetical protein